MPFSEQLKRDVRNKSHQRCCICHAWDVEVHHILPQEQDGPDTADNAAPLCGTCHNQFGGNPDKRKAIRESRDLWYDICANRYVSDATQLDEIKQELALVQSTNEKVLQAVKDAVRLRDREDKLSPEEKAEIDQTVKVMFNARVENEYMGSKYMEWLRELDPEDARWIFLQAKHDVQLLKVLAVMKAAQVEVVQTDEQEVTRHVNEIDVDRLEEMFWKFVKICGIPDGLVAGFRDDFKSIRENLKD